MIALFPEMDENRTIITAPAVDCLDREFCVYTVRRTGATHEAILPDPSHCDFCTGPND